MKFFLLKWEEHGNPLPRIVDWMEKLDQHAVFSREIRKLPKRTLLYIESNPETVFSDIISAPFFLVSDMIWDVMGKYDMKRQGKQIVLLDAVHGFVEIYHMPLLPECQCLHEDTQFNNDGSIIYELILKKSQVKELPPFFRIKGLKKDYIIGRLDFVESILRRGAKGLQLKELDIR